MAGCRGYLDGSEGDAAGWASGHPAEGAQMSKKKVFVAAMLGMLVGAGSAHAAGDPEAGKEVFKKCALCHTTEPGKNKIGPSLHRGMDRETGTDPHFNHPRPVKNFKPKMTLREPA